MNKIPQELESHLLNQPTDRGMVERYFEQIKRHPGIVKATRRSALNRLVWFVAIAGFALLNGQTLWSALIGRPIEGVDLFILVIPWVVTVLAAVAAHIVIDQVEVHDDYAFEVKYALLSLLLDKFDRNVPVTGQEFMNIVEDETEDLKKASKRLSPWFKWARRLEFWAQAGLIISFAWMLIGPYLIR